MNRIRLYDFLSFLLPGLLVSASICFFFSYIIKILPKGVRFEDLSSVGGSIIFLAIAFLIGHVLQAFGNEFEVSQIKYWGKRPLKTAKHTEKTKKNTFTHSLVKIIGTILPITRLVSEGIRGEIGMIENTNGGWYSRQLLRPENTTYDIETKRLIRKGAEKVLKIPFNEEDLAPKTSETEKKQADKKNQDIFNKMYTFIQIRNMASQTPDFNAQYGFYRGHCVALLFISWLSVFSIIYFCIKAVVVLKGGISPAFWQNINLALYGIIVFLLFEALFFLFRRRYERFAFYFANSVYQNFLVWWLSEKHDNQL